MAEEFDIDENTTVEEFVKLVNSSSSNINASFDEANGRIFINSKKAGVDNDDRNIKNKLLFAPVLSFIFCAGISVRMQSFVDMEEAVMPAQYYEWPSTIFCSSEVSVL